MNTTETVERIQHDFDNQVPPFDGVTFPEQRLLSELIDEPKSALNMEDRMVFISMFCTFDYNRDANQLVDNILELWREKWSVFDVFGAAGNVDELSDIFERVGFRYPNRDANAWATNCQIVCDKYHGQWTELLLSVGADAPSLVERLNEDDFLCLKGVKIAPMYARIINDEVAPLSNLWDLEIPVDTHIRKLSIRLFTSESSKSQFTSNEPDDDWIRREWRALAEVKDIDRHVVDGALWHIGNKWDEWGEDYWNEVTNASG